MMSSLRQYIPLPISIGLFKCENMCCCDIPHIDSTEAHVGDTRHVIRQESLHEDAGGGVVVVEGGAEDEAGVDCGQLEGVFVLGVDSAGLALGEGLAFVVG